MRVAEEIIVAPNGSTEPEGSLEEAIAEHDREDGGTYEFVCPRCWAREIITLTPGNPAPTCGCGSRLLAIAELGY